ncbi:response regulator transcription factor [Amycolatopsis thermophila]|uniref:DNA-binding response OmpR family regulator n=1 Tax=Amycolatopsis thermophila TaxID=206084 RepID=A0ABU0F5V5_9PSEU|nr:response regulator transcription factor [Amycolatopsis thermophila]MDQ0382902.1 DNA-binding response OmpR family regulator [Amycolatopsis thermophila]
MPTRVLLVEDDERIAQALSLALDDEDFDVMHVPSGERALDAVESELVELVLLDLMLPGMDGLTVCRKLRASGDLPIIVITARSDSRDVIAGLEAGADDYVTKPLVAGELAARMRALLRRRSPGRPAVLHVADLEVRLDAATVFRDGEQVHLTRTEFGLLAELAASPGAVVTREQLLSKVWGYDYFGDTRLLDVHIRRLRRKVEADPDHPRTIVTVRGMGYKIEPEP